MAALHLDTHVLVWLKSGKQSRLGKKQRRLIDSHDCLVSPMVLLELELLHEIGRITVPGKLVFEALQNEIGLETDRSPFSAVAKRAADFGYTRDPFDRIICAQADVSRCKLLTADSMLLSNFTGAVWG